MPADYRNDLFFGVSYVFDHQALVVTPLQVRMGEGGKAVFNVRLAQQPAGNVAVKAAWLSGDEDVIVVEGGSLTFTTENWQQPQRVLLAAAQDPDSVEDMAQLRVSSTGLPAEVVTVRVTDDDATDHSQPPGTAGQGGALGAGGAATTDDGGTTAISDGARAAGGESAAAGGEPAAIGGQPAVIGGLALGLIRLARRREQRRRARAAARD